MQSTEFPKNTPIHLSFSAERLESLIRQGKIHAADFNCLDTGSKKSVWSILLSTAAGRIRS